ncbi:hypothetical protein AF72_04990 [Xylella taiwanensis]|uniref:Uncharacterized protein n=1 Tax=Xylella taiwanensis TaxID=1444770 RepID=Z9JKZ0_9GAMM|nr:hypothetical protein AB672_01365 [Xylella taiwanensis]EWS78638.1 hypothetical protein AF72_04990 [Xylella taiwanensis]
MHHADTHHLDDESFLSTTRANAHLDDIKNACDSYKLSPFDITPCHLPTPATVAGITIYNLDLSPT